MGLDNDGGTTKIFAQHSYSGSYYDDSRFNTV